MLLICPRQSVFLYREQTTSPYITIINSAHHFKTSIFIKFTCIVRSYERARVDVSEVDDVDHAS